MASASERSGLVLARPLLAHAKATSPPFANRGRILFSKTPSNDDPVYARTRMRRLGRLLADEGLGRAALLKLGRRAARADAALAAHADAVRGGLAAQREPGGFRADISALADESEADSFTNSYR